MGKGCMWWDGMMDWVFVGSVFLLSVILMVAGCERSQGKNQQNAPETMSEVRRGFYPVLFDEVTAQQVADSVVIVRKKRTPYCFAVIGHKGSYQYIHLSMTWVPCPEDLK